MRKERRSIGIRKTGTVFLIAFFICMAAGMLTVSADEVLPDPGEGLTFGGGFAATGQITDGGYISEIYDASNGLPTSDANYILCSSDGYIWIGGYSGIIRYD